MTNLTRSSRPDPDPALEKRILERAQEITQALITRFQILAGDIATGNDLAALGGLDGVEREVATIRCILLLLR